MIENLVQMGLHLGVGPIDFLTKMARVLGNLFALTQVATDTLAKAVGCVSQLRIDDFYLQRRQRSCSLPSRNKPGSRRCAGRLWRRPLRGRRLLLTSGLRLCL